MARKADVKGGNGDVVFDTESASRAFLVWMAAICTIETVFWI